jgi:hypothetical protein
MRVESTHALLVRMRCWYCIRVATKNTTTRTQQKYDLREAAAAPAGKHTREQNKRVGPNLDGTPMCRHHRPLLLAGTSTWGVGSVDACGTDHIRKGSWFPTRPNSRRTRCADRPKPCLAACTARTAPSFRGPPPSQYLATGQKYNCRREDAQLHQHLQATGARAARSMSAVDCIGPPA